MDPTIYAPSHVADTPCSPPVDASTPQIPTPPTTPLPDFDMSSPASKKPTEPLYTEINIPLPPLPSPKPKSRHLPFSPPTSPRPRSHSLANSFRPFHRRYSSTDSCASKDSGVGGKREEEAWPRIKKEVKSREVAAAMDWRRKDRRSGTIDALAVVPAVLVLSAELFTPGEGKGRKKGGRWEDGMI